jgi:hypothetical protein
MVSSMALDVTQSDRANESTLTADAINVNHTIPGAVVSIENDNNEDNSSERSSSPSGMAVGDFTLSGTAGADLEYLNACNLELGIGSNLNNMIGMGGSLAKGVAAHNSKLLPLEYKLGDDDVICGRGSRCFNHTGNKKFRKLVEEHLERYANTTCKFDKTNIICEIVNIVRQYTPNGGFVKKDTSTGRYYEVGDFLAVSFVSFE